MPEPYYINPFYLCEGMNVWVAWDKEKDIYAPGRSTTGLRCEVIMAAGDAAIVENKSRGFHRLLTIYDLWVPPDYMQPGPSHDKVFSPPKEPVNETI